MDISSLSLLIEQRAELAERVKKLDVAIEVLMELKSTDVPKTQELSEQEIQSEPKKRETRLQRVGRVLIEATRPLTMPQIVEVLKQSGRSVNPKAISATLSYGVEKGFFAKYKEHARKSLFVHRSNSQWLEEFKIRKILTEEEKPIQTPKRGSLTAQIDAILQEASQPLTTHQVKRTLEKQYNTESTLKTISGILGTGVNRGKYIRKREPKKRTQYVAKQRRELLETKPKRLNGMGNAIVNVCQDNWKTQEQIWDEVSPQFPTLTYTQLKLTLNSMTSRGTLLRNANENNKLIYMS